MTGIRAGSQGTGVLEGSRPGTGVTGGSGPPSVISGNENILIELDTGSGFAPVADYTAPFDLSMSPLFDSLTTPVPRSPICGCASVRRRCSRSPASRRRCARCSTIT